MRRMATSKQLDYINDLHEAADIGFQAGTYPGEIEVIENGEINWEEVEVSIEEGDIDFENHAFDPYLYFEPKFLKEQYGLEGQIAIGFSEPLTMPDSVVDFQSLKSWMLSENFTDEVATYGFFPEGYELASGHASYNPFNLDWSNGAKLTCDLYCMSGQGSEIVGATNPLGQPRLDVDNLLADSAKIENLTIENHLVIGSYSYLDDVNFIWEKEPTIHVKIKFWNEDDEEVIPTRFTTVRTKAQGFIIGTGSSDLIAKNGVTMYLNNNNTIRITGEDYTKLMTAGTVYMKIYTLDDCDLGYTGGEWVVPAIGMNTQETGGSHGIHQNYGADIDTAYEDGVAKVDFTNITYESGNYEEPTNANQRAIHIGLTAQNHSARPYRYVQNGIFYKFEF